MIKSTSGSWMKMMSRIRLFSRRISQWHLVYHWESPHNLHLGPVPNKLRPLLKEFSGHLSKRIRPMMMRSQKMTISVAADPNSRRMIAPSRREIAGMNRDQSLRNRWDQTLGLFMLRRRETPRLLPRVRLLMPVIRARSMSVVSLLISQQRWRRGMTSWRGRKI